MNRVNKLLRQSACAAWVLMALAGMYTETAVAQEPECTVVAGLLYCNGRRIVIPIPGAFPVPPSTPSPAPAPPPPTSPTSNRAPAVTTISLQTFVAGQTGQFAVRASDPDGDSVRFSLVNNANWLSINALTGVITATPGAANVGHYASIVVRATDGRSGIASSSFSVDVVTMATGSVSLSWIAPTAREDGSTLTNLAGFRVYSGRSPADLRRARWLTNPGLSRVVLENIAPGRWYFALTALDAKGIESELSSVIIRNVP